MGTLADGIQRCRLRPPPANSSCQTTSDWVTSDQLKSDQNMSDQIRSHQIKGHDCLENSHVQECPFRGAGAFPGSSNGIQAGTSSPSSLRPRNVHRSFARLVLFSPPNMSTLLSTLHMQWPYLAFGLMPFTFNSLHIDLHIKMCTLIKSQMHIKAANN